MAALASCILCNRLLESGEGHNLGKAVSSNDVLQTLRRFAARVFQEEERVSMILPNQWQLPLQNQVRVMVG